MNPNVPSAGGKRKLRFFLTFALTKMTTADLITYNANHDRWCKESEK